MPSEGQKSVSEYKSFTITEKFFKQDPYVLKNPRGKHEVGWSFGIYGIVDRTIYVYTSWSHHVFFKEDIHEVYRCATDMIDAILSGKKIEDVSVIELGKAKAA